MLKRSIHWQSQRAACAPTPQRASSIAYEVEDVLERTLETGVNAQQPRTCLVFSAVSFEVKDSAASVFAEGQQGQHCNKF